MLRKAFVIYNIVGPYREYEPDLGMFTTCLGAVVTVVGRLIRAYCEKSSAQLRLAWEINTNVHTRIS